MRGVAFGLCAAVAVMLMAVPASAASSDQYVPNSTAGNSTPASINDHDGDFIPRGVVDRGFAINPDGEMAPSYGGDSDQDKDGSDIAIYQGEDDKLPS
jgi:hypothetical protein